MIFYRRFSFWVTSWIGNGFEGIQRSLLSKSTTFNVFRSYTILLHRLLSFLATYKMIDTNSSKEVHFSGHR